MPSSELSGPVLCFVKNGTTYLPILGRFSEDGPVAGVVAAVADYIASRPPEVSEAEMISQITDHAEFSAAIAGGVMVVENLEVVSFAPGSGSTASAFGTPEAARIMKDLLNAQGSS